jgi:hypothetical protein
MRPINLLPRWLASSFSFLTYYQAAEVLFPKTPNKTASFPCAQLRTIPPTITPR